VCNYSTTSAYVRYLPLAGYIIEQSMPGIANKEYMCMICPHDGTFYKIMWRPTTAQASGSARMTMGIGENLDTYASTTNFRSSFTFPGSLANTTYINEIGVTTSFDAGQGNETNAFSVGDIISIGFDPVANPGDVNCTVVLKYDMNT